MPLQSASWPTQLGAENNAKLYELQSQPSLGHPLSAARVFSLSLSLALLFICELCMSLLCFLIHVTKLFNGLLPTT